MELSGEFISSQKPCVANDLAQLNLVVLSHSKWQNFMEQ